MRKPIIWIQTRSDTNQAVQQQKQARSLKDCTIHVAKIKALIPLVGGGGGGGERAQYSQVKSSQNLFSIDP